MKKVRCRFLALVMLMSFSLSLTSAAYATEYAPRTDPPILTIDGDSIFANGNPITIKAASEDGKSNIYYDNLPDAPIALDGVEGDISSGYDLSGYTIYGGFAIHPYTGDTQITMLGGTVYQLFGGSGYGVSGIDNTLTGNTVISVSNDAIVCWDIYGGSNGSIINGDTSATVSDGATVYGSVYGGSANEGSINGNTSVVVEDAAVGVLLGGSVYGGSFCGSVSGDTDVTVSNSVVCAGIYGGGYGEPVTIGGTCTVNVQSVTLNDQSITYIAGGSYGVGTVGNTNITVDDVVLSGRYSGIYGGSMGYGDASEVGVTGSTSLTVKNCTDTISKVYGGCKSKSIGEDTSVTILDSAIGNVYGGCESGGLVHSSTAVSVGGSSTIGSNGMGVIINGGSGNIVNGVNSVAISAPLTGDVKMVIPTGFNSVGNPTIATGASADDLAHISLTGDTTTAKKLFLSGTDIKVGAPIEVTISGVSVDSKVYNGLPVTIAGTPVAGEYTGPFEYSFEGTGDTIFNAPAIPQDAGTYTLTVKIPSSSPDFIGSSGSIPFTIEKAPLTIKPSNKAIETNDALPNSFNLTYAGFVNGETVSVLTINGVPEYVLKNGESTLTDSKTAGTYTIQWSNKDDVEITSVNYSITKGDGELTITEKAPSGNGGTGGGNTTTPPKPTENPDGSKTTTETDKKTGTVTETTKYPDGKTEVVEMLKDGTVNKKVTTMDGTKTEQVKKPDGSMTAKEERKDGTKVESATTTEGKTTANVTVPKGADKTTVTIPTPSKPKAGDVAVIVKADGSKEVVKASVATEDGLKVTLPEGATLEIVDNSKSFADVAGDAWYNEAVSFASSLELFQGNGESFAPEAPMTRGMLMTVLYRFEGAETHSEDDKWYSDAQAWSQTAGISDGAAPEADISREQLAVILYRYSGSPLVEDENLDFDDGDVVSDWASDAMKWAISTGLIQNSGDTLNPHNSATRAEVAIMLQRFIENL